MVNKTKKEGLTALDISCARYHMKKAGIETYNKKSIMRMLIGGSMIVMGLVTFFVPFTTLPLCMCGAGLIGYDLKSLLKKIKYENHLLRLRI